MIAARLRVPSFAFIFCLCCGLITLLAAGPARAQTGSFPSGAVNLGSVAVNTGTPTTATLTFTFATGGTIGAPAVVTQGVANLDFTDAGTGTCTTNGTSHNYNPNETCTVVVNFAPRYAGTRYGGVVLSNTSGTPIATAYVYGAGVGPQLVFSPATRSTLGGGIPQVRGAAVDAAGNVFFGSGAVAEEIPVGCTSSDCMRQLGGGFGSILSLAIDGAGNLYVGEYEAYSVKEIPVGCASANCVIQLGGGLSMAGGVAVDGSGNIYVADTWNNSVKEMPPGCTSSDCVTALVPGYDFDNVYGAAVDGAGNLYVVDFPGAIIQIPQGCKTSACLHKVGPGWNFGWFLAVDGNGNVYAVNNNGLQEMPPTCRSTSCMVALGSQSDGYGDGVAVDGAGNIYVSNGEAEELVRTEAPGLSFAMTVPGATSIDSPQTIVAQNIGNSPLSFTSLTYPLDFPEASGIITDCTSSSVLDAGAICTLSIDFSPLADSLTGNSTQLGESVNLTVDIQSTSGESRSAAVNGTVALPVKLVYGVPPASTIPWGYNAGSAITVEVEFPDSTVVTTSASPITLTVTYPDGTTHTYNAAAVNGVATFDLSTVALSEAGSYTYTASSSGLTSATSGEVVMPSSTVGSAGALQTATLTLASSFVLGRIAVVTQGAPNLDFQVAAGGTCTVGTPYSTGDACTVNYTFKPRFSGTRYGAVVLYDNATPANAVATANLQETGIGPQVAFTPSDLTFPGGGFTAPYGVAMDEAYNIPYGIATDGNGNLYIADANSDALKEIPPGCTSSDCVVSLGGGFSKPQGVAVDGAGNLYVADTGNNVVKEVPADCTSAECVITLGGGISHPMGIAVDGNGNVYAASYQYWTVIKIPAGCFTSSCMITFSNAWAVPITDINFEGPLGTAVDNAGNLYVASTATNLVTEVPAGCLSSSCVIELRGGFSSPFGLAVDGNRNLYIADTGNNAVKVLPAGCTWTGCMITLGTGFVAPVGVAVDGSGNVYVADTSHNQIQELDRIDGPSLSFTPVSDGSAVSSITSETLTVQNIGNEKLLFPVPASGSNPSISGDFVFGSSATKQCPLTGSAGKSGGSLAASASCKLEIAFTPQISATGYLTVGSYSGSLALTNNTLNAEAPNYASQTVALSGTVTPTPPFGAMAQPIDATTRATTVAQADGVLIEGWAADPQMGAPVSQVNVLIDGKAVGNAVLGIGRPDIAAENQNLAYYNSGWTFSYPAAGLAVGSHNAMAVIADSLGLTTTLRPRSFTVAASPSYGPPFGALGQAIDAATRSTTVATGDNLLVTGWAADPHDGAPVSSVSILIDGAPAGTATLGIARPDVAAAQKTSAYLNSGWTFTMAASGLSAGTHTVSATASDSLGLSGTLGKQTITVAATSPDGPPFGSLGRAVDGTTGQTTVSQEDNLLVEGWAADVHDGAPVSQVSILIDGSAAGNATLGVARPDLAKKQGSRYMNSGWKFTMAASSLSAGTHTVTAVASDSLGLSTQFQIREITVTP